MRRFHTRPMIFMAFFLFALTSGCTISSNDAGNTGGGDDNQSFKTVLGCDDKATVVEQGELLVCQCPTGYTDVAGDGSLCEETNECEDELLNTCHSDATCTNTDGSFECSCNAGFDGDGLECTDIDECTLGSDTCDDHADCANTAGSFTCTCKDGWEGDGETCNDINECANADSNNCDVNATCTNIDASYTCECNTGFLGNGESCTDINECDDDELNECDVNAICTNTPGAYTCECKDGYNDEGNQGFACSAISCNPIDQPANGTLNCVGSNYYGDICAVTCGNGYNLNGPIERTCQANGLWSGNDNSCVPANCGEVIIENGTMTCPAGGTTYPNTCTVSCNNGHNLAGVNSLMCTANGTWGNTAPTCNPVSCLATNLPAPPFGSKQCPNGSTFGNSCTFTCQEGYTLSNDTPITCYADGNWSASAPSCIPASCPTLSAISDGTISLSDGTGTFGDSASYSCDTGYHLEVTTCTTGEPNDAGVTEEVCIVTEPAVWTRDCQTDGTWSNQDASCQPDLCDALDTVANGGAWSCSDDNRFDSTCSVTCNTGYDLSGEGSLTCGVDGWSGSPPTCAPKDCGVLESPANGNKVCSNSTTYGSECSFSCDNGYALSNSSTVTCRDDGTWSDDPPTCIPASCPTLSAVTNGDVTLTGASGTFGVEADYTCDTGYHLEITTCTDTNDGETCETTLPNSWSRLCGADGNWSNQAATCMPDSCAALPQIDNATAWDCTNGDLFDSQCSLTCLLGHDLSGDATRSCGADGWSGDAPTCTPKDCQAVTAPDHGFVELGELGSLYGGAATYSCALGYKLIAYNGASVGSATTESACTSNGVWFPAAPTCAVQTCTELATLTNGTLSYANPDNTTHVGAEATFACEDGYHLEAGDQSPSNWTIECDGTTDGNNGQWSGAAATCEPNVCEPLETVSNGVWDCDLNQNIFGESCSIVCADGYTQQAGDATRACVYENLQTKWSGIAPYCQGINECEATPDALYCAENASCTDVDPNPGELGYTCSCNTGYEDQSDGNGYICDLMDCTPFVTEVTNAASPTYENSWYNGTADIICDAGFEYIGGETNEFGHGVVTCNVDNGVGGFMWTTPGTCENIDECTATNTEGEIIGDCGENGHCIDDTDEMPGWYCGCDAGYETVGQWDSEDSDNQPGCAPMACPQYTEDVANGVMVYGLDEYLGTTEIVCVPGYTYVGNETATTDVPYKDNGVITCNVIENGNPTWNAVGTCEDIDECTATDAQGEIVGDCGPNSLACVNDEAGWHCDCKPGFEPSGDWTDSDNLPTCVELPWIEVTVGGASEGCMLNPLNNWSYNTEDSDGVHEQRTHAEHLDDRLSAPSFACGLKSDHTLWCWGYPIFGERPPPLYARAQNSGMVDLSWSENTLPVQIGTANDWVTIDAGTKNLCGIRDADTNNETSNDRTLWCLGQHWDNTVYGEAFQIGDWEDWQSIEVERPGEMCGTRYNESGDNPDTDLKENRVYCMGSLTENPQTYEFQGGGNCNPDYSDHCYSEGVTEEIHLGTRGSCEIGTSIYNGNATTSSYCELFDNSNVKDMFSPFQETTCDEYNNCETSPPLAAPQSLAMGGSHQCIVDTLGSLYCWGSNSNGQTGLGFNIGYDNEQGVCEKDMRGQTQCYQTIDLPMTLNDDVSGDSFNQYLEVTKQQAVWSRVWAGGNNTCAENVNGDYYCWGSNSVGQVGQDPSFELVATPQHMSHLENVQDIAMAGCNSCALTDSGEIQCWGGNDKGTLGISANKSRPTKVSERTWTHLSTGMFHTCGITPLEYGHSLRCWGLTHLPVPIQTAADGMADTFEELNQLTYSLGYPELLFQPTTERETAFFIESPKALATGDTHNHLLTANHNWRSWGSNYFDEGVSVEDHSDQNNMISLLYSNVLYEWDIMNSETQTPYAFTQIATGKKHNCALNYDRDDQDANYLKCWGNDACGQIGYSIQNNQDAELTGMPHEPKVWMSDIAEQNITPFNDNANEFSDPKPWTKVVTGAHHTCALRQVGSSEEFDADELYPLEYYHQPYCWGLNFMGQVPQGGSYYEDESGEISNGSSCVLDLYESYFFEIIPGVFEWDSYDNRYREYSNQLTITPMPTLVGSQNDQDWTDIAAGAYHSCGIRGDNGSLFCWGDNRYGQLGIGNSPTQADQPRFVGTGWSKVFAGYYRTCAIKSDSSPTDPNTLWCWGLEAATSLGQAERSADVCNIPKAVNYESDQSQEFFEDLTSPHSTCQRLPTKVSEDTDFNELQFGFLHTCALKTDDSLWCWGNNQYGQLGDGDILSTTPLNISINSN